MKTIKEIITAENRSWIEGYSVSDMLDRIESAVLKRIAELEAQVLKVVNPRFTGTLGYNSCECGQGMRIGSNFCSNCGAKLDWSES